jgi:hypothetical protein
VLSIVAGDKMWKHHYDPANILQSVEYRHNSSQPKTFKEQALTRKVMNALLDEVLTQFVEKGTESTLKLC